MSGALRILWHRRTAPQVWDGLASRAPAANVFYSHGYSSLFRAVGDIEPLLFHYEDAGGELVSPAWLRPLGDHAGALPPEIRASLRGDLTTPEYTGPAALGEPDPERLRSLHHGLFRQVARWCRKEGIVCEFMRLNPFGTLAGWAGDWPGVRFDRPVVYIDLSKEEETLWREFSASARKNYKRAVGAGLEIGFHERPGGHLDDLVSIYREIMDRREAPARYRFSRRFFESMFELLAGRTMLARAHLHGRTVGTIVYLHDGESAFSYLGGVREAENRLRPTNFIISEMMRWAAGRGIRRLVLGGGYRPEDGIYRFKRNFSRTQAPFHTFRAVHLEEAYRGLVRAAGVTTEGHYFPAYRR